METSAVGSGIQALDEVLQGLRPGDNVVREVDLLEDYRFDKPSSLVAEWATDELLANFFQVTCPYLYELDTTTYFALGRRLAFHFSLDPRPPLCYLDLASKAHSQGSSACRPSSVGRALD